MTDHRSSRRCPGEAGIGTAPLQQLSRLACSNLMQGLLGAISAVDGIRARLTFPPSPRDDASTKVDNDAVDGDTDWMMNELIFLEQTLADHALAVSSLTDKVRVLLDISEDRHYHHHLSSQQPNGMPGSAHSVSNVSPVTEKSSGEVPRSTTHDGKSAAPQVGEACPALGRGHRADEEGIPAPRLSCGDNSPASTVIVIDDEPPAGEAPAPPPPRPQASPESSHESHPQEPVRLSKAAKKRRRKARARQRQRAIMELVNREKAGEDLSEFEVDVLESFLNDEVPLPPSGLPPELLRMARELCEEWERQQMQQEDKLEEVEYFMMDLADARQTEEGAAARRNGVSTDPTGAPDRRQQQILPSAALGVPEPGIGRPSTSSHLPAEDENLTAIADASRGGIPVWNEWETLGQVAWKIEDMLEEVVPPPAATKRDRPSGITDARPPRVRRAGSGEMKIEIRRTLRAAFASSGVDSLPRRPSANQRLLELRSVMDCLEDSMYSAGENDPSAPPRAVVDMLRATLEKMWPRSSAQNECRPSSERRPPPKRRGRTGIREIIIPG
ncbi:hypothetical protein FOZ60_009440 [Perkinsus olseni]|uniref:Uncharacterized protein n=1 Tax=Perkinsus olseni TaxID=32597 RepID=A0A7J6PF50_PEROL|nr:hypothetical protein FOZ60_009440 [Perkinsus olseni]